MNAGVQGGSSGYRGDVWGGDRCGSYGREPVESRGGHSGGQGAKYGGEQGGSYGGGQMGSHRGTEALDYGRGLGGSFMWMEGGEFELGGKDDRERRGRSTCSAAESYVQSPKSSEEIDVVGVERVDGEESLRKGYVEDAGNGQEVRGRGKMIVAGGGCGVGLAAEKSGGRTYTNL